ncbi:hypothetical protein SAMN03159284_03699 [Mucilaginibacter sp. NFR10]|nr:hypothetical protein SAMN03159284_03699 [Mucilaginibacter sp. NFR10]
MLLLGILFFSNTASAQKRNLTVNPLTGAAQVNIPIYNVSIGQLSLPISLNYYGGGIKNKDAEGTAGIGWNLSVGGQVSRVVRGLPDDVIKDNSGNNRFGWMSASNTGAASIDGFTIANTANVCTTEATDLSYMSAHFGVNYDTEPDIFNVSAPGLSCQLIYNRTTGKFVPVGYDDLVVTYAADLTTHLINSFTITNDKGVTYVFGNNFDTNAANEKVTETAVGTSPSYFTNRFQQYQYGITYSDNWGLLSMTDANHNLIELFYSTPFLRLSKDTVSVYPGGSTTASMQYYMSHRVEPVQLQSIEIANAYNYQQNHLTFTWSNLAPVISTISGSGLNYKFGYRYVTYGTSGKGRYFLGNVTDLGCNTPVNYQFAYNGETQQANGSYMTVLPDSLSRKSDYWGYYSTLPATTSQIPSVYVNPSNSAYPRYLIAASGTAGSAYTYTLSNNDRSADATVIASGSLNKITYAEGGSTNIVYEPNDFYDPTTATVIKGGGARVKQVIDSVGTHSSNNIIQNYTYLNPSTGKSSGKPLSLPQYAFTQPYSGTNTGLALWTSATVLSTIDLSEDDHTIMYEYAKSSQTGAGSTQYQYYLPATYYDASAAPASGGAAEWYPTIDNVARNNCSQNFGPVTNGVGGSPFTPNTNYDFERGLPLSVTNYNEDATPKVVSQTTYTYQRPNSPSVINAFRFDDIFNGAFYVRDYSKYKVFYNAGELNAKVISKVFDSPTLSVARIDTTTYTFGGANHHLVTQVQKTGSNKSISTTTIKYTKDYTAAAGSNPNVTAIYNLQQQNINIPVESYQQVTQGGTTKTIGAGLTLFKKVIAGSNNLYLPAQQFKMVQADGLTGFVPMSISGQTLTYDAAHYVQSLNVDSCDNTGTPLTVSDIFKHRSTVLTDHFAGKPVATFKNVSYAEVAYSSFDSDIPNPGYAFTINGTGFAANGSHAGNAYGLATTQMLTHTFSKNPVSQKYILSAWINAPAGTNTVQLSLAGAGYVNYTYTGTGGWKYYEWAVPVSALGSTFSFSLQSLQNISIDDILFYPDLAEVSTANYNAVNYTKTAETNTNGVSAYYTYDKWGRLLNSFDQDHNIVGKNTYISSGTAGGYAYTPLSITPPATIYSAFPATFSVYGLDSCTMAGVSVTWNFGDGTSPVTTAGLISPSHAYTNGVQTYTVNATLNSPLFGSRALPPINVTTQLANIPIHYTTDGMGGGDITSVSFVPVGGGTTYSFTGSQLNSSTVLQGDYTINIYLASGQHFNATTGIGYNSVSIANQQYNMNCSNWVSNNRYAMSCYLLGATAIYITVSHYDCSHFLNPE